MGSLYCLREDPIADGPTKMNVWLIHPGEPLPIDGPVRLLRYGVLSEMIAAKGHRVTQWACSFAHSQKRQRSLVDEEISVSENQSIQLMFAGGYKKNRSLARIRFYREASRAFSRCAPKVPVPDVILVSLPSPGVCRAVLEYASPRGVPVVVDVRDLWPDIFIGMAPRVFAPVLRAAFWPARRANRAIFRCATAITAISEEYLRWGLKHSGRGRTATDRVFPMGYPRLFVAGQEKTQAERRWIERGVRSDAPLCCFLGSITRHYDFRPVVAAAKLMADVQFLICGEGDDLEELREATRNLENVFLPGWVNAPEIVVLMEWAHVGLAPYAPNAKMSLPNKVFEYLFGGLPVVSSLGGELESLLRDHRCGLTYDPWAGDDLSQTLCSLFADPIALAEMGERARRLYEDRFSADLIYSELIEFLEGIARPPGTTTQARGTVE
jgi:glycosyltransferase involved in cell wall biosynthesis